MRDRLIELLLKVDYALDTNERKAMDSAEFIADYLLDKGVIVAPMPMAKGLKEELEQYVYKRCVDEL